MNYCNCPSSFDVNFIPEGRRGTKGEGDSHFNLSLRYDFLRRALGVFSIAKTVDSVFTSKVVAKVMVNSEI